MKRLVKCAALAIGALVQAGGAIAAGAPEPESPLVTYQAGRFSEFIVHEDGSVLLFPDARDVPQLVWKNNHWQENRSVAVQGVVRDAIPSGQGEWLLVSRLSYAEACLYRYSDTSLNCLSQQGDSYENPTLHLAQDGCIWVTTSGCKAFGYKDGKVVTHTFSPEPRADQEPRLCHAPELSISVPDRGLWFWAHAQLALRPKKDVPLQDYEGFHVYQDGSWRVEHEGAGRFGGAALAGPDSIVAAGLNAGLLHMSVTGGSFTNAPCVLSSGERCTFMHRTPAGRILLMTSRPKWYSPLPSLYDGRVGRLLAWENGQVRALLAGVDFKSAFYDKGRPAADVPEGTFIAEAQNGLLFVSDDLKTVRRLDWRYGEPLPNVERMRVVGKRLYLLDRARGFTIIDYPKLLQAGEPTDALTRWSVATAASKPLLSPTGSIWYLAASAPLELRHWNGTEEVRYEAPPDLFFAENHNYLTMDTKGRVWIYSAVEPYPTAVLDKGVLRAFALRETAYAAVAKEESGDLRYRLGGDSDLCQPAFSGDGRVAYRDEWGRLSFYDGSKWHSGSRAGTIDGKHPQGHPFYADGLLTVRAENACYQYGDGVWRPANRAIVSPCESAPKPSIAITVPTNFPGSTRPAPPIRLRDNSGAFWVGDLNALWRGVDDVWTCFPLQYSPLCTASEVTSIQVDASGCLWFALAGGDYPQLARYRPPGGAPPRIAWSEQPATVCETKDFDCALYTAGSNTWHLVRYQLNDGPWQSAIPLGPGYKLHLENLTNGQYTLRAQAYSELLCFSQQVEHAFTVQRDYVREIRQWTMLLASPDFSQREQAAKALASIGAQALPALLEKEARADASAQWWIRATREEIERRLRSTVLRQNPKDVR